MEVLRTVPYFVAMAANGVFFQTARPFGNNASPDPQLATKFASVCVALLRTSDLIHLKLKLIKPLSLKKLASEN